MTVTVDFEQEASILSGFEPSDMRERLPEEEDAMALVTVYQQIADRRAQLEDAETLRRARAL
ncbi:MAG: hypothetical protein P4L73_10120 [Caulobacteraceae bacterium]|nr:hypothetical protein [Caulobacteraceae bacterium]